MVVYTSGQGLGEKTGNVFYVDRKLEYPPGGVREPCKVNFDLGNLYVRQSVL